MASPSNRTPYSAPCKQIFNIFIERPIAAPSRHKEHQILFSPTKIHIATNTTPHLCQATSTNRNMPQQSLTSYTATTPWLAEIQNTLSPNPIPTKPLPHQPSLQEQGHLDKMVLSSRDRVKSSQQKSSKNKKLIDKRIHDNLILLRVTFSIIVLESLRRIDRSVVFTVISFFCKLANTTPSRPLF